MGIKNWFQLSSMTSLLSCLWLLSHQVQRSLCWVGIRSPRDMIGRHSVTQPAATKKLSRAQLQVLDRSASKVTVGCIKNHCSDTTGWSHWKWMGNVAALHLFWTKPNDSLFDFSEFSVCIKVGLYRFSVSTKQNFIESLNTSVKCSVVFPIPPEQGAVWVFERKKTCYNVSVIVSFVVFRTDCLSQEHDIIIFPHMRKWGIHKGINKPSDY